MGIFEIKLEGFKRINVIVMRNAINMYDFKNSIRFKFDIKGSKLNRSELPKTVTKGQLRTLTEERVLKDNDLKELISVYPNMINLSFADRMAVVQRLQSDADFLESQGIMDYSLLIAIEESNSC